MILTTYQADLLLDRFRDLVTQLEEDRPPVRIRLPNLRISYCEVVVATDRIQIRADVVNSGVAVSGECSLQGHITVVRPDGSSFELDHTERCPKLQPGWFKWFRPFHEFANPGDGHGIFVELEVDPPTQARPGGEVWELNETDNRAYCTVYTSRQEPQPPPDIPDRRFPPGRPMK